MQYAGGIAGKGCAVGMGWLLVHAANERIVIVAADGNPFGESWWRGDFGYRHACILELADEACTPSYTVVGDEIVDTCFESPWIMGRSDIKFPIRHGLDNGNPAVVPSSRIFEAECAGTKARAGPRQFTSGPEAA